MNALMQAQEWDEDLLWNAGPVKTYRESAPAAYNQNMEYHDNGGVTWK